MMEDHQSTTLRKRQPASSTPGSQRGPTGNTPQEDEIIAETKRRLQRQAENEANQIAAAKKSFFWSILIVAAVAALFFGLKVYGFLDEPNIRKAPAQPPKWSNR